ncbi:MAG TPA: YncE family protein [Caulobacteraceae bacterium]|nr:YncE family protein [Caulobacteraceae bacterium]
MIRPLRHAAAAALLAALALPAAAAGPGHPSGLHVAARIGGPDGGWDYASFDAARRRVYVAHGSQVIAIDADSGKANFAFAAGAHLHSIAAVPGADVLVTTNSGDDTARIIAASDGRLLASIPVAKDADGAQYDPASGLVVVISGDGGALTLVDPGARKAVGSIVVGDKLEFGAPDGKGRFFVNLVEKNEVAMVDLAARKVLARYALPGCAEPTGLAYVAGQRLIVDCGNGGVDILDAGSGRAIATFKVGGFPDAVLYDPRRRLAYVPSAFGGTLSVIALSGPRANTIIDTIPTQLGARTGAVDPKTGRVYLPTAEYILPVPAGQRPTTKPGTFAILVLDR